MNSKDHASILARARQVGQAGRVAEAEGLLREIVGDEPGHAEASLELASLLSSQGRAPEAVAELQTAVRASAEHVDLRLQLAQLLRSLKRNEEALTQYEAAASLDRELPAGVWNNLGNIYREMRRPDDAERSLLRAIELEPKMPAALNNLGSLCAELGRADEAQVYFRRAISAKPDYFRAYGNLSGARQYTQVDDEVRTMQTLYVRHADNDFAVMQLGFALGKVFEDLGEPGKAFQYWSAGNRAQRKMSSYSLDADIAEMRSMRKMFDADRLATRDGASRPGVVPLFVLGMPRSGTSLTEQILDSHSSVFGAGELDLVQQLAGEAVEWRIPDGLASLSPETWKEVGERYLDAICSGAGGRPYVVDKLPRNFHYIGMISMMLRDARFIHCRRDPMDVGLSCFKHSFLGRNLDFSCDLDDLGTYYRSYESLMDHWRQVVPAQIYEMCYEDLVAEPEQRIRELLAWCGLSFEESCLNFHRNRRMIATASALQVRRPIHRTAVRRWKAYEKDLEPLRRALERPIDD